MRFRDWATSRRALVRSPSASDPRPAPRRTTASIRWPGCRPPLRGLHAYSEARSRQARLRRRCRRLLRCVKLDRPRRLLEHGMHSLRGMIVVLLLAQIHRGGNKGADFINFNWWGV